MAQETPVILSHNILEGAEMSGAASVVGNDLYKLSDHLRHTYFKATTTAEIEIIIRAATLTENSSMETNITDWSLDVESGGSATFAHNTTTPINGVGDGKVVNSVAAKWATVYSDKIFLLKGGRTYRIMGKCKPSTTIQARIGWSQGDLTILSSADKSVGGTLGVNHVYTPSVDTFARVFVAVADAATVQWDDIIMAEARTIDTIIIDKGHNLQDSQVEVMSRVEEMVTWNVTNLAYANNYTQGVYYKALTTSGDAINWRIRVRLGADNYEIPSIHLGKKWTLTRPFTEPFDNDSADIFFTETTSIDGISKRELNYNARQIQAQFNFIAASDYADIQKFYEDVKNGEIPFWILPRPTTQPLDALLMKMKGKERRAPEGPNIFRSWGFTAQEITGARR